LIRARLKIDWKDCTQIYVQKDGLSLTLEKRAGPAVSEIKSATTLHFPHFSPHPSYFILLVTRALGAEIEIKLSA